MTAPRVIYTVGHGDRSLPEFLDLLQQGGIDLPIDVRRFPGSRRHPHFARESLDALLVAGARVVHLLAPGDLREHRLSPLARVDGGELIYDRDGEGSSSSIEADEKRPSAALPYPANTPLTPVAFLLAFLSLLKLQQQSMMSNESAMGGRIPGGGFLPFKGEEYNSGKQRRRRGAKPPGFAVSALQIVGGPNA